MSGTSEPSVEICLEEDAAFLASVDFMVEKNALEKELRSEKAKRVELEKKAENRGSTIKELLKRVKKLEQDVLEKKSMTQEELATAKAKIESMTRTINNHAETKFRLNEEIKRLETQIAREKRLTKEANDRAKLTEARLADLQKNFEELKKKTEQGEKKPSRKRRASDAEEGTQGAASSKRPSPPRPKTVIAGTMEYAQDTLKKLWKLVDRLDRWLMGTLEVYKKILSDPLLYKEGQGVNTLAWTEDTVATSQKVYYALMKYYHPDQNKGVYGPVWDYFSEEMSKILQAIREKPYARSTNFPPLFPL